MKEDVVKDNKIQSFIKKNIYISYKVNLKQ